MRKVIALGLLVFSLVANAHKTDSVGTKVRNGKVYIMHKVEPQQGLYSISKKYNVPLKTLIAENPGSDQVIKVDQIIWIPTEVDPVMEEKVVKDYFDNSDGKVKDIPKVKNESKELTTFAKYHTVQKGETLYSIAKKYETTEEMIKTLNNLNSEVLSLDQRLLVQDGKAESTKVTKVDDDYANTKAKIDASKYKEKGFDTQVETSGTSSPSGYSIKVEKLIEYNIEKIEETGTGTVGGEKVPNDKNFALHFNAPIGTVLMVTNPDNKKTVFVKIIGNFNKAEMSSEIIRLSPSSAEQIDFTSKGNVLLSYAR
jgi:LysM repeat protein